METEIKTSGTISISQDGVWAGNGTLHGGSVQDCDARLGAGVAEDAEGQIEESERAYAAIESAIAQGLSECECDGCRYSWHIED